MPRGEKEKQWKLRNIALSVLLYWIEAVLYLVVLVILFLSLRGFMFRERVSYQVSLWSALRLR